MKKIAGYVKAFVTALDPRIFFIAAFFISTCIFLNYHYGLNYRVGRLHDGWQYLYWYFIFLIAFSFPYLLYALFGHHRPFRIRRFLVLLLLSPALFSWKMVYDIELNLTAAPDLNNYWEAIIYWPFKLLVITTALYLIWKLMKEEQPLYGLTLRHFQPRPYFIMLLIMMPLIAAASTQPDFLAMYPKMKDHIFPGGPNNGFYKLLYELSYGSDFFTIELFFRGFLVLAFVKWFGKDAILPMACFYCTIHFGKPLGECISSFFGGMILGIVIYHTRTIFGGLMVHLGIAWMMELGGYVGGSFLR